MADISRIYDFEDGQVLTEAQLDAEFNQIIATINALDNDNIAASAAIAPSKISSSIKGSAIARDASTGALSVKVDDSSLEISADALQIKALGVTTAKLAADAVNGDKIADDAIDSEHYVDGSIDTAHLADNAVTQAKRVALNLIKSSTEIDYSTSSTSYQTVTNATLSIETTGRPVFIGLQSFDGAGAGKIRMESSDANETTLSIVLSIRRDASSIYETQMTLVGSQISRGDVPCGCVFFVDEPSAATYTYDVQIKGSASVGTPTVYVDNARLIAYEL